MVGGGGAGLPICVAGNAPVDGVAGSPDLAAVAGSVLPGDDAGAIGGGAEGGGAAASCVTGSSCCCLNAASSGEPARMNRLAANSLRGVPRSASVVPSKVTRVSQVSPIFRDVTNPLTACVEPRFTFGVAITASSTLDDATKVSADSWSCPLNGVENAGESVLPILVDASGVKPVIVTNDGSCFATLDSSSARSGPPAVAAGVPFLEKKSHDAAPDTSTTAAAAAISHGVFVAEDAVAGVTTVRDAVGTAGSGIGVTAARTCDGGSALDATGCCSSGCLPLTFGVDAGVLGPVLRAP